MQDVTTLEERLAEERERQTAKGQGRNRIGEQGKANRRKGVEEKEGASGSTRN